MKYSDVRMLNMSSMRAYMCIYAYKYLNLHAQGGALKRKE